MDKQQFNDGRKRSQPRCEDILNKFIARFDGLKVAYGHYVLPPSTADIEEGEKHAGRGITKQDTLTADEYESHLRGEASLGVVPIQEDNSCVFGAIDIDVYSNFDLPALARKLAAFPVIVCRTKSGGAHVYLFTSEKVPASLLVRKLRELAQWLGYGKAEVFPKQVAIQVDRGDVGGWINLPYFGGARTDRYALHPETGGALLDLTEFLDLADKKAIDKKGLKSLAIVPPIEGSDSADAMADGPPCLKFLLPQGFSEGGRNTALLNLGVYLRLRYPEDWQERLEDYNRRFLSPPLSSDEVITIRKSLDRKEYSYTCEQSPLVNHCNRDLCLKQKFGIGGKNKGKGKESDRLVNQALEQAAELWQSQDGDYYATVTVTDHKEHMAMESPSFKLWLAALLRKSENKAPSANALNETVLALQAEAFTKGVKHTLYPRVAGDLAEKTVYVDLADEQRHVVRVTADGWAVVRDCPVKFKRTAYTRALPLPVPGGSMEQLRPFVNLTSEADFLLLKAWLVGCFQPWGTYPLLSLTGRQGSAKSTVTPLR